MGTNRYCCLFISIPAFFLSLSLAVLSVACGGSPSSTSGSQAKTLTSVSVSPATANISAGSTQQFTATAKYSDGSTADVTSSATWAAATQSVATVTTGGLAKGMAPGSTTVSATVSGMSGSATLKVAAALTSIAVSPSSATIVVGATQQFSATATYSDGSTVNVTSTATWTSATPSVATVSSSGLATGVAGGSSVVTAALGGVTSAGVSLIVLAKTVTSIAVSPPAASTYTTDTEQFTATASYSDGSIAIVTSTATWASATTSVATISSSGLATGVAAGTSAITAALAGVTSPAVTLTVQAKAVTSIAVTPGTASTYTTDTQQFSATATYNDGSTASVTSTASWTSSVAGVATINSSGLATGVTAGTSMVTASLSGITSPPSTLTVQTKALTSITVAPANPNVAEDGTLQFGATGTYNDGSTGNVTSAVTWSVDHITGGNSADGTVTTAGLYTAPSSAGSETVAATSPTNSSITASATVTVANAPQGAVLTYHNDDARDGAYTQEVTLMPSNVNSTTFGKLYAYPVNGQIMGQPLYMPQMSIAGGTYDVVFVATENNYVYAFNADATSSATAQVFWQLPLGAAVLKAPNVYAGIQSTPVIDPSTNTIYLVAEKTGYSNPFFLYALNAATGSNQPGSPVNITATYGGDSLESSCDQRVGLALDPVSNAVYIGFGDCTHGWVVAYDKTTLAQTTAFDDTNGAEGGGLWSSGGAPAIDDTTGDLYLLTGTDAGDQAAINNTNFTQVGYNNSFLRLDATDLSVLDYFSPDNSWTLAENDADLASGGNVIMPASSVYPPETIGGGKDGNIYVVNRSNMGGFNATNDVIQTIKTGSGNSNDTYDNIFDTPVYWNGSLYFHCNDDVLRAYSWSATTGLISTSPTSVGSNVYGMHGATASLSANGTLNGIVWDIDNTAFNGSNPADGQPAVLHAYNATNVAVELYNTTQAANGRDTAGAASKFTVPTIAGGKVFVPTSVELDIYGLLP